MRVNFDGLQINVVVLTERQRDRRSDFKVGEAHLTITDGPLAGMTLWCFGIYDYMSRGRLRVEPPTRQVFGATEDLMTGPAEIMDRLKDAICSAYQEATR